MKEKTSVHKTVNLDSKQTVKSLSNKRTVHSEVFGLSDGSDYWYLEEDLKQSIKNLPTHKAKCECKLCGKDLQEVIRVEDLKKEFGDKLCR